MVGKFSLAVAYSKEAHAIARQVHRRFRGEVCRVVRKTSTGDVREHRAGERGASNEPPFNRLPTLSDAIGSRRHAKWPQRDGAKRRVKGASRAVRQTSRKYLDARFVSSLRLHSLACCTYNSAVYRQRMVEDIRILEQQTVRLPVERMWLALLRLSFDPFPSVSTLARVGAGRDNEERRANRLKTRLFSASSITFAILRASNEPFV